MTWVLQQLLQDRAATALGDFKNPFVAGAGVLAGTAASAAKGVTNLAADADDDTIEVSTRLCRCRYR